MYGLLKRPDEKYVTEKAYDNPKFVEDMVRDIATELKNDKRIKSFVVESEILSQYTTTLPTHWSKADLIYLNSALNLVFNPNKRTIKPTNGSMADSMNVSAIPLYSII